MKKSILLFFIPFFIWIMPIQALQKRPEPMHMKTSIIVPCHFKHFILVPGLLENLKNQTVMPDEVIISITEQHFQMVEKDDLSKVKEINWPFDVKIVIDPSLISSP